jgi:hypothetical protein
MLLRRAILCAIVSATAAVVVPVAPAPGAPGCPTEKICLWNQPNFTGKMMIQEGGRCQRPPAQAQFGPIRSVKNRTTKKPDGGQWYLRMWTATDCNCSRSCATQWDAEIRAGQERADLNPGQESFEAVFVEPDCPTC